MAKIAEAIKIIEEFAPLELAEDFDNCGLKIGGIDNELSGILLTVDTNADVVREAAKNKCNLIIEHHPSIWKPLKAIDSRVPLNNALLEAAKSDIAIYSAHTNVDYTENGLNDFVAKKMGLLSVRYIGKPSSARIGELKEAVTLAEYTKKLSKLLDDDNVIAVGDLNRKIKNVAVINGGGGGNPDYLWETYNAGADVFVTAEVKHSVARLAKDLDYAIIQFGHYASEADFITLVREVLEKLLKNVPIFGSESITNPYNKRGAIWN